MGYVYGDVNLVRIRWDHLRQRRRFQGLPYDHRSLEEAMRVIGFRAFCVHRRLMGDYERAHGELPHDVVIRLREQAVAEANGLPMLTPPEEPRRRRPHPTPGPEPGRLPP